MEAHGEFLRAELGDRDLAEAIKKDYRQAPLDEATRALLDYSVKLTLHAHTCKGRTLQGWINSYSSKHHRAICLVNVTDHYVVTHLGQVNDNRSKHPCPVAEHYTRRRRIENVWIIKRRSKS